MSRMYDEASPFFSAGKFLVILLEHLDEYLTELIHLELKDHKTQVTVISVIDHLLDIRNIVEVQDNRLRLMRHIRRQDS